MQHLGYVNVVFASSNRDATVGGSAMRWQRSSKWMRGMLNNRFVDNDHVHNINPAYIQNVDHAPSTFLSNTSSQQP
jgi:hypothetical protein